MSAIYKATFSLIGRRELVPAEGSAEAAAAVEVEGHCHRFRCMGQIESG